LLFLKMGLFQNPVNFRATLINLTLISVALGASSFHYANTALNSTGYANAASAALMRCLCNKMSKSPMSADLISVALEESLVREIYVNLKSFA
jgi:hypothetical protein